MFRYNMNVNKSSRTPIRFMNNFHQVFSKLSRSWFVHFTVRVQVISGSFTWRLTQRSVQSSMPCKKPGKHFTCISTTTDHGVWVTKGSDPLRVTGINGSTRSASHKFKLAYILSPGTV